MNKTLLAIALTFWVSTVFAEMDHGSMSHSKMKETHSSMTEGHSKMDHSNMMSMKGMSDVGMPAKGAKPDKVVHVILSDDMKITFKKEVNIEPNDVVQFVVMNTGKVDHEFSIGSETEQIKYRDMMKSMSHHDHDSGSTVTVQPGKAKQLLWHFHGDRNVEFSCNIAGHFDAGMTKKISI